MTVRAILIHMNDVELSQFFSSFQSESLESMTDFLFTNEKEFESYFKQEVEKIDHILLPQGRVAGRMSLTSFEGLNPAKVCKKRNRTAMNE